MANRPHEPIEIDGAFGEGGGQIVRSSLALSAITGQSIYIKNIRAGRRRPGLGAQHLAGVEALRQICAAKVTGNSFGSEELFFEPGGNIRPGDYVFDISSFGTTSGSATLLLHTIIIPLLRGSSSSTVTVKGGTHIPFSPSFEHVRNVWRWSIEQMGGDIELELKSIGWFPNPKGEILGKIHGRGNEPFRPFFALVTGPLKRLTVKLTYSNIPRSLVTEVEREISDVFKTEPAEIVTENVESTNTAYGVFIIAEYSHSKAGFDILAGKNKLSIDDLQKELKAFKNSRAAIDSHLADQLMIPCSLASAPSEYSVQRITSHVVTNAWVIHKFRLAKITIHGKSGKPGIINIKPLLIPARI